MENMGLNRFVEILDSIVHHRNSSLELFRQNWQTAIAAFQGSSDTRQLLREVEEVVDDALTHMPGKKSQPKEVDWDLWATESDALSVVIARECLMLGVDLRTYLTARKQLSTLQSVRPPYLNEDTSRSVKTWLKGLTEISVE